MDKVGKRATMVELAKLNWIPFSRALKVETDVDLIAVKILGDRSLKYRTFCVKTSMKENGRFSFKMEKANIVVDPTYFLIFCLIDGEKVDYLVLTIEEWREKMGAALNNDSWISDGVIEFFLDEENFDEWREFLNQWKILE